MEPRKCSKCAETKPLLEFPRRYDRYATICKACKREHMRTYARNNTERVRQISRRSKIKAAYGISVETYEDMLKEQGGKCAICHASKPGSRTRHFPIDHCHTTGVVRGLLCTKCNRGLGLFEDDTDRIERAASYLKGITE